MKYIAITAVKAFENDIRSILKKSSVRAFTYMDVTGFRDTTNDPIRSNWFASDRHENESILFYVFVEKEKVDSVFEGIKKFNDSQESDSHVHVVMFNVERSNEI